MGLFWIYSVLLARRMRNVDNKFRKIYLPSILTSNWDFDEDQEKKMPLTLGRGGGEVRRNIHHIEPCSVLVPWSLVPGRLKPSHLESALRNSQHSSSSDPITENRYNVHYWLANKWIVTWRQSLSTFKVDMMLGCELEEQRGAQYESLIGCYLSETWINEWIISKVCWNMRPSLEIAGIC